MVKKIITVSYVVLVVTVMVLLVLCNIPSFIQTTNRFKEVFDLSTVKIFFEQDLENSHILYEEIVTEVTDNAATFLSKVYDFFTNDEVRLDSVATALSKIFDAFCDFLI